MTFQDRALNRRVLDALMRSSFFYFTWKVFDTLHAGGEECFIPNWHVEAMCHAATRLISGEEIRLVTSVPPRHLKSITMSVALPAFILGRDPSRKILVASYALELARKHADDTRTVMESDWYRRAFPATRLAQSRAEELRTTRGGIRRPVSTGGTVTGFGADFIIVDDLLKAQDAASEQERERAKTYLDNGLLTRFNKPAEGRLIVIQQRLHEDDPAGHVLAKGNCRHLNLPAIATDDEEIALGEGRVHVRQKGEALFPQRFSRATLEDLRRTLGPAAFEMQYQQDPVSAEGSTLRWEWFHVYDERPPRNWFQRVIQSWDTGGSSKPDSDYSVCTTWGHREGKWYLLDLFRRQLDFPDLVKAVKRLVGDWNPDKVLIENASSGIPLLQECRQLDRSRYIGLTPKLDKEVRFNAACGPIEAGTVLLPRQADWLLEFRREILAFPRATNKDQADSLSQFLGWAVSIPGQRGIRPRERRKEMKRRP